MVLTTEPAAVLVVNAFRVVEIGGAWLGLGAGVTAVGAVAGAADTVLCVGIVLTTGLLWTATTGPEPTLIETTVKHTGLPERAESKVTLSGIVPEIGVVTMSTWIRSMPEASTLRVISWNESGIFSTDPRTATYEGSGNVNSNE
jgi:hypothetical protein